MIHKSPESALPPLTGLQYLVLALIANCQSRDISGRQLRSELERRGVKSSGPQFYQMMSRLEDSEYVTGFYAQLELENQVVNERRYRITNLGESALETTSDFYFSVYPARVSETEKVSRARTGPKEKMMTG